MTITQRTYRPEDFVRVRDFLSETYPSFDTAPNWRIEHWNWGRYHVVPMLGTYQKAEHRVEDALQAIASWEGQNAIWENGSGAIVGVVTTETPWPGGAFLQRRPGFESLLPALLDYVEARLVDPEKRSLQVRVYEHDQPLRRLVEERGYVRDDESLDHETVLEVGPGPVGPGSGSDLSGGLPPGYAVESAVDRYDIETRREIIGRSFNHTDPQEWPNAFSQEELQRAPDYREDLDLVVVGPDGKYVACCIAWLDLPNRMAILEPVGTHPDYRRRGFARAVVMDAVRRAAALGATRVFVGSSQTFYTAIGFRDLYPNHWWTRRV